MVYAQDLAKPTMVSLDADMAHTARPVRPMVAVMPSGSVDAAAASVRQSAGAEAVSGMSYHARCR